MSLFLGVAYIDESSVLAMLAVLVTMNLLANEENLAFCSEAQNKGGACPWPPSPHKIGAPRPPP